MRINTTQQNLPTGIVSWTLNLGKEIKGETTWLNEQIDSIYFFTAHVPPMQKQLLDSYLSMKYFQFQICNSFHEKGNRSEMEGEKNEEINTI